jgi:hypothetical protein
LASRGGGKKGHVMDFPEWLPQKEASEAEQFLSQPYEPEEHELVKCLISDLRMKEVWETLSRQENQPRYGGYLIHKVLTTLIYWADMSQMGLLLTPKKQKERISKIFDAIENLEDILKENHQLIINYHLDYLNPIDEELNKIKNNLNKYTFFSSAIPQKTGAKNAKRTFFMKELKFYMTDQYKTPLNKIVAIITCVVFNDENVTEDDVRKA